MRPALRKFALTLHVAFSVGWLGAVVGYLALAVSALTSSDESMVRAAYLSMELVGWLVIVPLSLAALVTGLVQSLGTEWGLFRHYWVLAKFVLTVGGVTVLLLHMPAVSRVSAAAAEISTAGLGTLRHPTFVAHAGGGLLVLVLTTTLSVYKPRGMTPYGRRKHHERRQVHSDDDTAIRPEGTLAATPWQLYLILAILAGALVLGVLHVTTGGPGRH